MEKKDRKIKDCSQKPLDFCSLTVYHYNISGQLNIVCHFRMKPVMVANVYDW